MPFNEKKSFVTAEELGRFTAFAEKRAALDPAAANAPNLGGAGIMRVYRVDPTRIDDFDKGKRSYAVLKNGGGSGAYDPSTDEEPSWLKGQKYDLRRGLFATDYKRALAYLIPRDVSWIRYGINDTDNKPVLYLNTRDRRNINSYRPYLSSFDSSDFEKLTGTTEEYFSSNPPKPLDIKRIKNVLNTLRKYYNVRFVPDLIKLYKKMKAERKHFESEKLLQFIKSS